MLAIELLKISREILKSLSEVDVRLDDYRHIGMYNEYRELAEQGLKKEYIRRVLAEKYKVSESTVFRVVSRLEKHIRT